MYRKTTLLRILTFLFLSGIVLLACQPEQKTTASTTLHAADSSQWLSFERGVRAILEDSRGHLWFGSPDGLARYDGEAMTYFSTEDGLCGKGVYHIQEDDKGTLWLQTSGGLCGFDGTSFFQPQDRDYTSKDAWDVAPGDLWFTPDVGNAPNEEEGGPGVYRLRKGTFTYLRFPVLQTANAGHLYMINTGAKRGPDGSVWFGTFEKAIGYGPEGFQFVGREELGLADSPNNMGIRTIAFDSQGRLWVGDNGHGVLVHAGDSTIDFNAQHRATTEATGKSLMRAFAIEEGPDGAIWIGTVDSGVWRYHEGILQNYTEAEGMTSQHIWTIYRDKQDRLWFGSESPAGVYTFDGSRFTRAF